MRSDNTNLPETSLPKKTNERPFIVVIGTSAGGLETLKTFFRYSTPNSNLAFIVITHLSPDHSSILPELLQRLTQIKVVPIDNGQKVQANHIYVLPPSKNVTIHNGLLGLSDQRSDTLTNLPINFFLNSVEKNQGTKTLCIILSGMGNDGTIGLKSLREQGGVVIAQTINSARYDSMPKSAIDSGLVDYILPPEKMFDFLLNYIAQAKDGRAAVVLTVPTELQQILVLLKEHTGHDFSLYKPNTIYRRIQKRLKNLQLCTLSTYISYMHQHPQEVKILFEEILINVTSFFRDPDAFELLKKELLKRLLKYRAENDSLRIWIPACSSGEEVYSLAIIIHECMTLLNIHFNVQIFGTDIDEDAIEVARKGLYPARIKKDISPERLQRYFTENATYYKINTDIRKMIVFAVQNLIKDPPLTKLNLLSCRNFLIYLKPQLQKKIFPLFHYSLNPHGLLFLGTSEHIGDFSDLFDVVDKKWKIFERTKGRSSFQSGMSKRIAGQPSEIIGEKMSEKSTPEIEPNLAVLVKNLLLKNYTPACIVIDQEGTILYVYGQTSRFLELAPGEARLHLLDMIRPELKLKLPDTINRAIEQKQEVVLNQIQLKEHNNFYYINVKVRPIIEKETENRHLLAIIFEDVTSRVEIPTDQKKSIVKAKAKNNFTHLEQELQYTKDNLQATIVELEASNEEMKLSNEELQSANEELQSTNEEIETSKEELQSLNEELTTVNAELESRIEQLSSANDDIKNLLDNTEIATIFLDKNLCIKKFTLKATEIINLIATDIGRPISHIVSNLDYKKLVEDARTVLKTLEPITSEGIDKNNHWYMIRIIPYRTVANLIDGVVITFLSIQAQKQAELKLVEIEKNLVDLNKFNLTILNTIPNSAILLNKNAEIIDANPPFIKRFKKKNTKIIGLSIDELKIKWDNNLLKHLIEEFMQTEAASNVVSITMGSNALSTITFHKLSSSALLIIIGDCDRIPKI